MKTLYISDLDGTLLNKNAELSDRSAEIIGKLINKGLTFSVATARSISSVKIIEKLPINVPVIQLNGVLLYDVTKRKYIDCVPIDTESAKSVIEILRKFNRMSFVYKIDNEYGINVEFEKIYNDSERNFFYSRKRDYKSFEQVKKITINNNSQIIYFTMIDKYDSLLPIYSEIKKLENIKAVLYSDNYSNYYFLEIFSSEATKANSVQKLKKIIGADKVVAFGDNFNDIDMLKIADVGIAVGNSVDELKKYADIVIADNDNDGVAEYLNSLKIIL